VFKKALVQQCIIGWYIAKWFLFSIFFSIYIPPQFPVAALHSISSFIGSSFIGRRCGWVSRWHVHFIKIYSLSSWRQETSYILILDTLIGVWDLPRRSASRQATFLRRCVKLCYVGHSVTASDLFFEADDALFRKILYTTTQHTYLHTYLPMRREVVYYLRTCRSLYNL